LLQDGLSIRQDKKDHHDGDLQGEQGLRAGAAETWGKNVRTQPQGNFKGVKEILKDLM
jgi:hypothetical protein